jgi:hypothetical protein
MGVGCKNSRTPIGNEPVSCGSSIRGIAQRPISVRRSGVEKIEAHPGQTAKFLEALAATGSVTTAVADTADPDLANDGQDAEDTAADRLEEEARRRALERVPEPLVTGGKLVRDDGQPIMVPHYSDSVLLAYQSKSDVTARRSVRFVLPALQSLTAATRAAASIVPAVAAGEISPGEAAELSGLLEIYVKTYTAEKMANLK